MPTDPPDSSAGAASRSDARSTSRAPEGGEQDARTASLGRRGLLGALALAFLLQIVITARSPMVDRDGVHFVRIAQRLSDDPITTMRESDQHPGYPALILVTKRLLDALGIGVPGAGAAGAFDETPPWLWQRAGRVPPATFGLLAVFLVFRLTRRVLDARAAVAAAIVMAILPAFRRGAANALSDPVQLALFLGAIVCAIRGLERRAVGWILATGLLSGLAYLVRPEGLEVAIVVGLVLGVAWIRGVPPGRSRTTVLLLALAAGAAVPAAPYALAIGSLTKKTDVTKLAEDGAGASRASAAEGRTPDTEGAATESESIVVRTAGWLALVAERVAHGLRYLFLVPLAAGLFLRGSARCDRRAARLLGLVVAFHLLLLLVLYLVKGYVSGRHVVPILALALPWIGRGVVCIADDVAFRLVPRWHASRPEAAWIATLAVLTAAFLPWATEPLHGNRASLLDAARYLHEVSSPHDGVLSNYSWFLFYADRPGCVIYEDGLPIREWCSREADTCTWLAVGGKPNDVDAILLDWGRGFREEARFRSSEGRSVFESVVGRREAPP